MQSYSKKVSAALPVDTNCVCMYVSSQVKYLNNKICRTQTHFQWLYTTYFIWPRLGCVKSAIQGAAIQTSPLFIRYVEMATHKTAEYFKLMVLNKISL